MKETKTSRIVLQLRLRAVVRKEEEVLDRVNWKGELEHANNMYTDYEADYMFKSFSNECNFYAYP